MSRIKTGQQGETCPGFFHYTTSSGFLGIVSKKQLWATNIHYMNDWTEFANAIQIAREYIQAQRENMLGSDKDLILDALRDRISSLEYSNIFVASFTEFGNTLSQWRGYAGGSGISIGIRYSEIQQLADKSNFYIVECIYKKERKRTLLQYCIREILESWTSYLFQSRHYKNDPSIPIHLSPKNVISDLASRFQREFIHIAPAFKDFAFRGEKEWRLVSEPISDSHPSINHRAIGNSIIPYFEFNLLNKEISEKLPIGQVIIGPRQGREQRALARRAVESFLIRSGLDDCVVNYSKIPYRTSL